MALGPFRTRSCHYCLSPVGNLYEILHNVPFCIHRRAEEGSHHHVYHREGKAGRHLQQAGAARGKLWLGRAVGTVNPCKLSLPRTLKHDETLRCFGSF